MNFVLQTTDMHGAIKLSLLFMFMWDATAQPPVCYGTNCQFDCHCVNNQPCDRLTGYCANGCASLLPASTGWYGPNCQRGNIAYKKPTDQSSDFYGFVHNRTSYSHSDYGVDGITNPEYLEWPCTHTLLLTVNPWWMVDLGALHVVETVTLYNRLGVTERLRDFYIRVGNTSAVSDHAVCAYRLSQVASAGILTLACDAFLIGRYVSVQLNYNNPTVLSICEAVIIGYKFFGCPPGYHISPGCDQPCNDQQFGFWCQGRCQCRDQNEICDKVTGSCPRSGCKPWSTAGNCSVDIRMPGAPADLTVEYVLISLVILQWKANDDIAELADIYPQHYRYEVKLTDDNLTPIRTLNVSHFRSDAMQVLLNQLEPTKVYFVVVESFRVNNLDIEFGARSAYLYFITGSSCIQPGPTTTPSIGVPNDVCRSLSLREAPVDGYLLWVELLSPQGIFCEFHCNNPAAELVPDAQSYIHCGPSTNHLWSFELVNPAYTFPLCVLNLTPAPQILPVTANICERPPSQELVGAFLKILVEERVCSSVSSCLVVNSKIVCGQNSASANPQ